MREDLTSFSDEELVKVIREKVNELNELIALVGYKNIKVSFEGIGGVNRDLKPRITKQF